MCKAIAYRPNCIGVPLDTPTALLATELHRSHKLATVDAIVCAESRAHGADLLTCDADFEKLPGVLHFAKAKAR